METKTIKKPINVHQDIITTLCSHVYSKNLMPLRNEIKYSCSQAYWDIIHPNYHPIYAFHQQLSTFMISLANIPNEHSGDRLSLLHTIHTDYIYFSAEGELSNLSALKNNSKATNEAHLDTYMDT